MAEKIIRRLAYQEVNEALQRDPDGYIERCETAYSRQVRELCQNAIDAHVRCILLAGPSSSGKTTTAKRICQELHTHGKAGKYVSLDDFYIDRHLLPFLPDGTQDLETIDAIDIPLLHRCLGTLLSTGKSDFPIFDFPTAKRLTETRRIEVDENHILVIEGIHALNPVIPNDYDDAFFYKAFISVATDYTDGDEILLERYDMRLIRRMIRDIRHRNASLERTLSMWKSVRNGENHYISPHKGRADYMVESLQDFEPGIFREYLTPLIKTVDQESPYYRRIHGLYGALCLFHPVPVENLPVNSLLHEFVG